MYCWLLHGGASPQREDAASKISFNLGLRLLLLSVATIVDLDQFSLPEHPKTPPVWAGRLTFLSPQSPFGSNSFRSQNVGLLHVKTADCCSVPATPPSGQRGQYRVSQPPMRISL